MHAMNLDSRTHLTTWEPKTCLVGPVTRALDEFCGREKVLKSEENVRASEGSCDVAISRKAVKDEVCQGLGGLDVADVPLLLVAGDGGVLRTGVRCVKEEWIGPDR